MRKKIRRKGLIFLVISVLMLSFYCTGRYRLGILSITEFGFGLSENIAYYHNSNGINTNELYGKTIRFGVFKIGIYLKKEFRDRPF